MLKKTDTGFVVGNKQVGRLRWDKIDKIPKQTDFKTNKECPKWPQQQQNLNSSRTKKKCLLEEEKVLRTTQKLVITS